jgi:hypothetical protein
MSNHIVLTIIQHKSPQRKPNDRTSLGIANLLGTLASSLLACGADSALSSLGAHNDRNVVWNEKMEIKKSVRRRTRRRKKYICKNKINNEEQSKNERIKSK